MAYLRELGHEVIDLGCPTPQRTDYPRYGAKVAKAVVAGEADLGVAICGSGIGISMSANKVPGCRAACVSDPLSAALSRRHNNANVICFGERIIGIETAKAILDAFLGSQFEGGRHEGRVAMLDALDQNQPLEGC